MTTLEEYVELFLTWIPLLASKVVVYQIARGLYPTRVVDSKDLSIREKLLIRRRAASFHYANKHDINIMFCEDSILFTKKAPEDQQHAGNLLPPPMPPPQVTILRQVTPSRVAPFPARFSALSQPVKDTNDLSEAPRPYSTR